MCLKCVALWHEYHSIKAEDHVKRKARLLEFAKVFSSPKIEMKSTSSNDYWIFGILEVIFDFFGTKKYRKINHFTTGANAPFVALAPAYFKGSSCQFMSKLIQLWIPYIQHKRSLNLIGSRLSSCFLVLSLSPFITSTAQIQSQYGSKNFPFY